MFWTGCTDPNCAGHNDYVPLPSMVNLTDTDTECYGAGGDCLSGWRVNDTLTFGTVTTTATWDAVYYTSELQYGDANMGLSKSYWFRSQCVGYQGFVELAYAHGSIKAPVAAFYMVRVVHSS